MAKIISMFNHKGGVSKTTTAYHIAWMLSELGRKVILVDADSQCNLTNIAMGDENFESYYEEGGANIKSAITPAFEGMPTPINAFNCLRVKNNDKLWLIPGSFELTEYEVSLGVSFTLSDTLGTLKNLPGSLFRLLDTTAQAHEADYIIIDLNPSLSAFNQAFLISSDYFIVPAAPDKFSIMALNSLAKILPQWEQWAIKAREVLINAAYPLPDKKPKFLGTIMQRFNIRSGAPTAASQSVITEFDKNIEENVVPAFNQKDMLLDDYDDIKNHCLGLVPDFQTLNARYQQSGYPIFALTDEMLGHSGTVQEAYKVKRAEFNTVYREIVNKIEQLINAE